MYSAIAIWIYAWMAYSWWKHYNNGDKTVPIKQSAIGFPLLIGLAGAAIYPAWYLIFGVVSLSFLSFEKRRNPFHYGMVAAVLTGGSILLIAELVTGDAIAWYSTTTVNENRAGTWALSSIVGLTAVILSYRNRNTGGFLLITLRDKLPSLGGASNTKTNTTTTTSSTTTKQNTRRTSLKNLIVGNLRKSTEPQETQTKTTPTDTTPTEATSRNEMNNQSKVTQNTKSYEIERVQVDKQIHPFKTIDDGEDGMTNTDTKTDTDLQESQTDTRRSQSSEPDASETQNQQKKPTYTESSIAEEQQSMTEKERLLNNTGLDELQFNWEEPPDTRFTDIGGYTDVKDELGEKIIKPLQADCGTYERFQIEPSKGVLFHGPPGTGKTLFARGLANELNRPFVELTQADLTHEFVNKSPQIINRLFTEAQILGGVVFIDEAEQLLGGRGDSLNTHQEDQKITNMFLSALTKEEQNFIILLTTNRRGKMDEAILRPGRVDEEIEIGLPDEQARKRIVKVKLADIPHQLSENDADKIAKETNGYSGADLEAIINYAKFEAAERDAKYLQLRDVKEGFKDFEEETE